MRKRGFLSGNGYGIERKPGSAGSAHEIFHFRGDFRFRAVAVDKAADMLEGEIGYPLCGADVFDLRFGLDTPEFQNDILHKAELNAIAAALQRLEL